MDADAWDARYAGTELVWSAGPNQFVERDLADLPPGRALDLACGEGRNARWLARRGWSVVGMDFSPAAIDKARRLDEHQEAGVDWQVGDATSTELPTGLDLVVVAYLQLPTPERALAVRRSFDALAPGGMLYVVAHDSTNLIEGTGGPQDPTVLYTAEDVLADLAGADLEVVHADRVARVVPARDEHGSEGTAWDALVHLRRVS